MLGKRGQRVGVALLNEMRALGYGPRQVGSVQDSRMMAGDAALIVDWRG